MAIAANKRRRSLFGSQRKNNNNRNKEKSKTLPSYYSQPSQSPTCQLVQTFSPCVCCCTNSNTDKYLSCLKTWVLFVVCVVQNSSTVVLGRYNGLQPLYNVSHLIVVVEISKLILAMVFGGKQSIQSLLNYNRYVFVLSCCLYGQWYCLFTSLTIVSTPLFQVIYQSKLMWTTIFSAVFLKQKFTWQQWVCVHTLFLGSAISTAPGQLSDFSQPYHELIFGFEYLTLATIFNSVVTVYAEHGKNSHNNQNENHHQQQQQSFVSSMQTIAQQSLYMAIMGIIHAIYDQLTTSTQDREVNSLLDFFHDYTVWVWALVASLVFGGIFGPTMRHHVFSPHNNLNSNVATGLSPGIFMMLSITSARMIFLEPPLTFIFGVGALIIVSSIYFFYNPLPSRRTLLLVVYLLILVELVVSTVYTKNETLFKYLHAQKNIIILDGPSKPDIITRSNDNVTRALSLRHNNAT